jgi:hypothetical protein
MLIYEVKILHPSTKEILFQTQGPRPELPSAEFFTTHPGAILIINTRDSLPGPTPEVNKRAA